MKSIRPTLVVLLLVFTSTARAQDYSVSIIAEGLDYPWSLAFLPNGEMLIAERTGNLRIYRDGELLNYNVNDVPAVYAAGQGGLFDVVIDPNFNENELLYLSYAAGTRSSNALHVVQARLEGATLISHKTLLEVTPTKDTPHHYGGRMALLPDATLLVTSGDGFDYREQAQSLQSLLGKVLRINRDGTIPDDNPFVGRADARPEIYSYGHRNPQAILVSVAGDVWLHEHGPKGGDELNLIEPGRNYGWPAITHGMDYSGAYVSPFTKAPGMEQPVVHWTPSIAPAGMAELNGDLYVAALAEKSLRQLKMAGATVDEQTVLLTEFGARIRDVRAGPDGKLYLLTDASPGSVLRLDGL